MMTKPEQQPQDVAPVSSELDDALSETARLRLVVEKAVAERDLADLRLQNVYRSTSWRMTAPVRSFKSAITVMPSSSLSGLVRKISRAVRIIRFAWSHWGGVNAAQRAIAILRSGGIQTLRRKLLQTERAARIASVEESARHSAAVTGNVRSSAVRLETARTNRSSAELGTSYEIPNAQWTQYVDTLLRSRLGTAAALQASGDRSSGTTKPKFWIMFELSGETGSNRLQATMQGIAELQKRSHFTVAAVAVSPSPTPHLKEVVDSFRDVAGLTLQCSFEAALMDICESDLVLFVKAGDVVRPEFGAALSTAATDGRVLILTDLYAHDDDSAYPLLLPGINFCYALNCDYFRSRFVARADAVRAALGSSDVSMPYDIAVSIMRGVYVQEQWDQVSHIDLPLISIVDAPGLVSEERSQMIAGEDEGLFPSLDQPHVCLGKTTSENLGKISVIICTKDKGILLRQIVSSLLSNQTSLVQEIIIVSNSTTNQHALRTLRDLRKVSAVTVLHYDSPFNFSAQSNLGAKHAMGEFLLFLNDDIVPTTRDWLENLMVPFANPRVGITSPLLLYPDESVQHAGMYLGFRNVAGHTLRRAQLPDQDYMFLATAPRFVSVVTGAAMLMRRTIFERLNGFDTTFATYIQDVDLCLRVGDVGYDIVFNPRAVLIHMESPSINRVVHDDLFQQTRMTELELFLGRWGSVVRDDPFHNPTFFSNDETLRHLRKLDS